MKIIAQMNDNWLVEATPHELARVAGYDFNQSLLIRGGIKLTVGATININTAWHELATISTAPQKLSSIKSHLEELPKSLNGLDVPKVNLPT